MFKNKHTIAALIIAPLLSIGGYFMLDAFVGEKPHSAESGQSYPLITLPNCRYSSGKCTLKNNEFKVELQQETASEGQMALTLSAQFPLQAAKLALVADAAQDGTPTDMQPADTEGKIWHVTLPASNSADSQLRLVVMANGALYFGATGLDFLNYDTPYHQDFRTATKP